MAAQFRLKLHKGQKIVMNDKRRFRVVVAGRRWGKTQVSKVSLIIKAAMKPRQLVWYVAPTYQQARDILWEDLKAVAVILVMLAVSIPYFLDHHEPLSPQVRNAALAFVLFYFGSR